MLRVIKQPDEISCGPASLAMALQVLELPTRSLKTLRKACRTNGNGTSTGNLVRAITRTLHLPVVTIRQADLRHIKACLRSGRSKLAVIVPYLYDLDRGGEPIADSGHWAVISDYSPKTRRLTVFDSYTGRRKSYAWADFRLRWRDYDLARIRGSATSDKKFRFVRRWHRRMLLIVAADNADLPEFNARLAMRSEPSSQA